MEILLLGTGAADGWPNPFCSCASCAEALAAGDVRGQSAALVDGRLLLDCGPEVLRSALRSGVSLAGVRHVLVTHSHPDHAGPAALLFRSWAGRREPLDLVGPPEALEVFRDWVGPDDPVRSRPIAAGDILELDGGYVVRALAATHGDSMTGPGLLYDVTAPDGGRVLWATDTGPLREDTVTATTGRAYDVLLMEDTFGDQLAHEADHLDLATFPQALAELRRVGAVVDATDVVAVHLGHRNPPTPELARRLAPWGARVVPDGTTLRTGVVAEPAARVARHPGRTLVLGGARSGKSAWAEAELSAEPAVTYVATSGHRPDDPEWLHRVALHRARRPAGWTTVETTDLAGLLRDAAPGQPLLIDCATLWLTAVADECALWESTPLEDSEAAAKVADRCDELVAAWRATAARAVLVSNEVGAGVVPASAVARWFRDELGRLNARLATEADHAVLLVAGQPLTLKGDR